MSLDAQAAAFMATHAGLRLALLTTRENAASLDRKPFGIPAEIRLAEEEPDLVARYHAANRRAFPSELGLPGWVLGDLYLMPSAIGLLLCPPALVTSPTDAAAHDPAIGAAYVAVPSLDTGTFVGVSLLAEARGIGAGAWIKALTLRALGARHLRGTVQWGSPSLRVHTRFGPLRIVGPAPQTHERHAESFVYRVALDDDARLARCMRRDFATTVTTVIDPRNAGALRAVLARVAAGAVISVVPPGLDEGGHVLLAEGHEP